MAVLGFILGDGALDYGRENIEEIFYTAHVWRGLFFAGDVQHINNPGHESCSRSCYRARYTVAPGILNLCRPISGSPNHW